MSIAQSAYDLRLPIGLPGQITSEEKVNKISRTVESAAGIEFGQPAFRGSGDHGVVVGATFAGTAAAAALGTNTGNGTITSAPAVAAGAKAGRYTVTMLEPASNAGEFVVEDPDGVIIGNGTVAVALTVGGVGPFTVADGSTDFAAGDQFSIDVTFTANADFVGLAVLNPAVPPAASTPDKYPQYFTGSFMTMGPMLVTAGASVTDGDPVYWNPATKRYTANTAHVRIPDAFFDTSGADGELVELVLKLRS